MTPGHSAGVGVPHSRLRGKKERKYGGREGGRDREGGREIERDVRHIISSYYSHHTVMS